jgi:hypothetical protein
VTGQDSVQAAVYGGKLRFFWGDTGRQSYPLGLFRTAGATADLLGDGGLDPAVGVNLRYFTNADGFARDMVPGPEAGPVWIEGLFTLPDADGRERLLTHAALVTPAFKRLKRWLAVYD